MAHVAGGRTRRKVYFLTPAGVGAARALRDHARTKPVLLADGADRREVLGSEAIESLKSRGVREAEATQLVLGGDLVESRTRTPGPDRGLPLAEPFVGRQEEVAALRAWLSSPAPLALVVGVAGIGKTSLATRVASESTGPVWYRKMYGFEDARTFAAALGEFLQRTDRPRLRNYLASGGFDAIGLIAIFREDLAGVLIVADDVHVSPEAAGLLRLAVDAGGTGKVLATARERPIALVSGTHAPVEVTLGGLDPDASRALAVRLLRGREDRIDGVLAAGRGHPMALHLLAASDDALGAAGAERLLEDAILEGLDPELERAAASLAVLRRRAQSGRRLGASGSSGGDLRGTRSTTSRRRCSSREPRGLPSGPRTRPRPRPPPGAAMRLKRRSTSRRRVVPAGPGISSSRPGPDSGTPPASGNSRGSSPASR